MQSGSIGTMLEPGTLLGSFVVLSVLGAGAMGAVYLAYDADLDRKVAIKVIRSDLWGGSVSVFKSRMLQEARALARLAHPNVVTIFAVDEDADQLFIAMEYIDGQTLTDWLKEKERTWQEILAAFLEAAKGLSAAHDAGLVHRDFKPDNVLVSPDGRICVSDFGIAHVGETERGPLSAEGPAGATGDISTKISTIGPVGARPEERESLSPEDSALLESGLSSASLNPSLTRTGNIMGTPLFMSLEQHLGSKTDARTDQFSFCVALYRALFNDQQPFKGNTLEKLCEALTKGEIVPPPEKTKVPAVVRDAILRGLKSNADDRFPTMKELTEQLQLALKKRSWAITLALVAVLVALGGSALAIGVATKTSDRAVCQGSSEQVRGMWNAEVKKAVRSAFLATNSSYAEKAADGVSQSFDRYVVKWASTHKDVCEATHRRGEQSELVLDLRMRCLEGKRKQMESLISEFKVADATIVANATQAAYSAGDLDECNDVESLSSPIDLPKSGEAELAIADVRHRLVAVQTQYHLGKYKTVLPEIQGLVAEAEAQNYAPLTAETYFLLGQTLWRLGRFLDSEEALANSAAEAEAGGHVRVKVKAWIELIYVVGFEMGDSNAAARWRKLAEAGLSRLSSTELLRAKMLQWSAGSLYRGGDFLEGIESLTEARDLLATQVEEGHFALGETSAWMANGYQIMGDYSKAKAESERGLKIRIAALGEKHPDIAESLNNLGNAHMGLGEFDEAQELYQQGLEIWTAAYGDDHPRIAVALTNLAGVLSAKGEIAQAYELLARALDIEERALGTEHPSVADTLGKIGINYEARGDLDIAQEYYVRTLTILTDAYGTSHPEVAQWRTALGAVLLAQGFDKEAIVELVRARAVWEKRPGQNAARGETEFMLAKARWANGEYEEAFNSAKRALSAYDAAGPAYSEAQAEVDEWLNEQE